MSAVRAIPVPSPKEFDRQVPGRVAGGRRRLGDRGDRRVQSALEVSVRRLSGSRIVPNSRRSGSVVARTDAGYGACRRRSHCHRGDAAVDLFEQKVGLEAGRVHRRSARAIGGGLIPAILIGPARV